MFSHWRQDRRKNASGVLKKKKTLTEGGGARAPCPLESATAVSSPVRLSNDPVMIVKNLFIG